MRGLKSINPMVRAIGVFSAVAVVVGGVTFAALQSQATLTNNTIASANAELQVKTGGAFAAQDTGFEFTGVVPGGSAVPALGNAFQLRNNGEVDLKISASIPTAPTFTVDTAGGEVDLTKVDLVLECIAGAQTFSVTSDLEALVAAHTPTPPAIAGVPLEAGFLPFASTENEANCTAKVQMDADAITGGSSASSGNFNLVFTGTNVVLP